MISYCLYYLKVLYALEFDLGTQMRLKKNFHIEGYLFHEKKNNFDFFFDTYFMKRKKEFPHKKDVESGEFLTFEIIST